MITKAKKTVRKLGGLFLLCNYSADAKSGRKTTENAERRGKIRFQSKIPRYSAFSVVNSLILCNTTE
jgi:hypothetical protein